MSSYNGNYFYFIVRLDQWKRLIEIKKVSLKVFSITKENRNKDSENNRKPVYLKKWNKLSML